MPPKNSSAPSSPEREVISRRVFDAPREKVFAAFSDPAQLTQWWGPNGFRSTFHEFDLRPGGTWRFIMHGPDGTDYPNHKRFTEVVRPERMVFRHVDAEHEHEMAMTFVAKGNQTELTWRMRFASSVEFEKVKPFVIPANEENFDRLAAHLSQHS